MISKINKVMCSYVYDKLLIAIKYNLLHWYYLLRFNNTVVITKDGRYYYICPVAVRKLLITPNAISFLGTKDGRQIYYYIPLQDIKQVTREE